MRIVGIYCYRDKTNGEIVYVGKDSCIDKNRRHRQHFQKCRYNHQVINRVLQNNSNRYEYEIILKGNISEKLLNGFEKVFIRMYDPKFCYTDGGDGTTGYKMTDEQKNILAMRMSGENAPWYGKKFSDEHKKKLSESMKGRIPWNKGGHHSEETKRKISESHKGENNYWFGKFHSLEAKQKMSKSHKKKYARINKHSKSNGKQRYGIRMNGKYIKHSINRAKLLDWFIANYSNEILVLNIDKE